MLRASRRQLRLLVSTTVICSLVGLCAAAQATAPIGAYTTRGAYSFVSAPGLHPPKLLPQGTPNYGKLTRGDFLEANFKNLGSHARIVGQSGPLILDNHLRPVWFAPVPTNELASNLKLQSYHGKRALSWWQGVVSNVGASISGELVIVDQHYHQIAKISGKDGWTISLHDAVIRGNTVWVTAYKNSPGHNLTPYHGPLLGTVYDSAVQAYDLGTGALLSSWDALAHIPLGDSYQPVLPNAPWDAYHVNSVQLIGSGQMLVSMRNTSAGYLVNLSTGAIVWRLGGKHSSFRIPRKSQFHWQHDIELHRANVVSVFDDDCCAIGPGGKFGKPNGPARGLVLKLDTRHHSARKLAQYEHNRMDVAFLGNMQLLGGGNVSIGWGSQPFFSEYSKSGKRLLDVRWPGPNQSYRSYVERWVGTPPSRPAARSASAPAS